MFFYPDDFGCDILILSIVLFMQSNSCLVLFAPVVGSFIYLSRMKTGHLVESLESSAIKLTFSLILDVCFLSEKKNPWNQVSCTRVFFIIHLAIQLWENYIRVRTVKMPLIKFSSCRNETFVN